MPPKKQHGLLLFSIATLLSVATLPLGILYSFFKNIKSSAHLDEHFLKTAISIDQTGNVVMQDLFNQLFITKDGCSFGNPDETISSVLGKNEQKGTLTAMGKAMCGTLNKIDAHHTLNSIDTHFPCEPIFVSSGNKA